MTFKLRLRLGDESNKLGECLTITLGAASYASLEFKDSFYSLLEAAWILKLIEEGTLLTWLPGEASFPNTYKIVLVIRRC